MAKPKFLHQLQPSAPCTIGLAQQIAAAASNKTHMQVRAENAILYEAIKQLTAIVSHQQQVLDARWSARIKRLWHRAGQVNFATLLTKQAKDLDTAQQDLPITSAEVPLSEEETNDDES